MASAFFAVLRDMSKLAATAADDLAYQASKMSAAADDIASLTGKATAKASGVAGDDLAVGAGQVGTGISPNRELPTLWRIIKGSALNKAVLGALLLAISAYAPVIVTIFLGCGALYLAFEGGEGVLEHWWPHTAEEEATMNEDQKVKQAVTTDMVLSLEILVIALSAIGEASMAYKALVLIAVSVIMTLGVYGLVGLIIRLDDMGLALVQTGVPWKCSVGRKMVNAAPVILKALEPIGVVAMFAVAGGILAHLLHVEVAPGALGLLADTTVGVCVGLLMAGSHQGINRLRGKS